MHFIDITGQKFRKLTALHVDGHHKNGQIMWLCQCDCGQKISVLGNNLRAGRTRSCGCLQLNWVRNGKPASRHNGTGTPEFRAWSMMRDRCRKGHSNSKYHGDRGIAVCERWNKFENFLADMGPRPSPKHSLDRYPNNDGHYEPGNCRWATKSEQSRNRRKFTALANYTDVELLIECKRRGLNYASEIGHGICTAESRAHSFRARAIPRLRRTDGNRCRGGALPSFQSISA